MTKPETTRRTRVAHVTTTDWSVGYLLLNQLQFLQEQGYAVAAVSGPGGGGDKIRASGIQHLTVPMTRAISPFRDVLTLLALVRVFRKHRFDIVHTHTPKAGLLGQLAARIARVPLIVNTIHGFYFHDHSTPRQRKFYVAMERVAAWCSHAILTQSREDLDTARREHIGDGKPIEHLGNGIDLTRFDPDSIDAETRGKLRASLNIPKDALVLGFLGRVVAEKGFGELLEAAVELAQEFPTLRVLVVGVLDTAKSDAMGPAAAAELGIGQRCIFTGLRQDIPELLSIMDVLTLPSYREGLPRSVIEASAMGVACVATDIRGCREAVVHGQNGLLVPARDAGALAGAIRELLRDPVRRSMMGANGRRLARERFDEQRVFATVMATYRQFKMPPTRECRP